MPPSEPLTNDEYGAFARLRELLRTRAERSLVAAVVHVLTGGAAIVHPALVNATPIALRAAAREFNRLADEHEKQEAAPAEPHHWWKDRD